MTKRLRCLLCDSLKPKDEFVNDRSRQNGRYPWCKSCVRVYQSERSKRPVKGNGTGEKLCEACLKDISGTHANRRFCSDSCKNKVRSWAMYGLSPDERRQLEASTNGICPICSRNVKRWAMDHNHKTGETTGLVCVRCNMLLLAASNHDEELVHRLLEYLCDPPVRHLFGERRYIGPDAVSQIHRQWLWNTTEKKRKSMKRGGPSGG